MTTEQDDLGSLRLRGVDFWLDAADSPLLIHRAILRLTYPMTLGVVAIALASHVFGLAIPTWLIVLLGAIQLGFTWAQERLLREDSLSRWMPIAHMSLALLLLSVGVAYSGGVQSPWVWVYGLSMATEGILRGTQWALGSATLSTVYLLGSTLLVRTGVVPFGGELWPQTVVIAFLVSYIGMFYTVALTASALRRKVGELSHLARADALTGLANRHALQEALEREIQRAERYVQSFSVVVVEIDHFKRVNDRYGHLRGDAVLRRLAVTLRKACRTPDFVARFGGDEFVLLLPQTPKVEAAKVAERIRQDVEGLWFLEGFHLTASLGVAIFPGDGATSHDLLEAADRAMYRVKDKGGNGVGISGQTVGSC